MRLNSPLTFISIIAVALASACNSYDYSEYESILPEEVDYNYHVKPILSDRCFACHGPDKNSLKADLRLDTEEGLMKAILKDGGHAFVSGAVNKSKAFSRIITEEPELQMPPPESNLPLLSGEERAIIAKWIDQGAEYKPHWSFIPVEKPTVPDIKDNPLLANSIDYFVADQLKKKKLSLNKEGEKEILLRRVTLDLTGLPPSLEEIDNFLADNSDKAWEKVVDRLLASPHYGERMAMEWMDVARYADSHGYSQDGLRVMWPWRDWVIKSYNSNMPYDKFITWQLAGDKLPDPTVEQRLATAFLRNQRLNSEGGIIQEEYMTEYAADRTETFGTAFLGLTMQCARCHDHKNDPVSQEEYYKVFSFFNNVNETGLVQKDGNSGPQVQLVSNEARNSLDTLEKQIEGLERYLSELEGKLPEAGSVDSDMDLKKGLQIHLDFNHFNDNRFENKIKSEDYFPASNKLKQVEGKEGQGIQFTGYDNLNINREELNFNSVTPFSFSFWIKSFHNNEYMPVLFNLGGKNESYPGYEISIIDDYLTFRMIRTLPANLIAVRAEGKVKKEEWVHYTVSYDGSGKASGVSIFENGTKSKQNILFDQLTGSTINKRGKLMIGGKRQYQATVEGYGMLDELKVYDRSISTLEAMKLFNNDIMTENISPALITKHQTLHQDEYSDYQNQLVSLREEKNNILDTQTEIMVMQDLPVPRKTFMLNRGAYDTPGKQVAPGTPESILPFPKNLSKDRLGLAEWLLDKKNPLTSRVIVNRFWQIFFGQGIVKTTEDFGSQGALPTHPQLLNWLAADFMESGWDIKRCIKQIVMSATYRQSSRTDLKMRKADPENMLLARGPSHRLQAEMIRDVALEASGLLVKTIGGESVKPYQPKGLWSEKNQFSVKLKFYVMDHGDKLYRRGLYTFWRRTSPPPPMAVFDAPTRDNCTVRRQKTNTPMQALVLLNAPQYTEASNKLAERVFRATNDEEQRIVMAYRLLTTLIPEETTTSFLLSLYNEQKEHFQKDLHLASDLLRVGETTVDTSLDQARLAALSIVCNTILNFDETIVKR